MAEFDALDMWFKHAILPAFTRYMSHPKQSVKAMVQIIATGLQESQVMFRKQVPSGPARGFLQIEPPTAIAAYDKDAYLRGELMNLRLNTTQLLPTNTTAARRNYLANVCELNDPACVLIGRSIMWLDPSPIPEIGDVEGAWDFYALKTWRPGKPRPEHWWDNYMQAVNVVQKYMAFAHVPHLPPSFMGQAQYDQLLKALKREKPVALIG